MPKTLQTLGSDELRVERFLGIVHSGITEAAVRGCCGAAGVGWRVGGGSRCFLGRCFAQGGPWYLTYTSVVSTPPPPCP